MIEQLKKWRNPYDSIDGNLPFTTRNKEISTIDYQKLHWVTFKKQFNFFNKNYKLNKNMYIPPNQTSRRHRDRPNKNDDVNDANDIKAFINLVENKREF